VIDLPRSSFYYAARRVGVNHAAHVVAATTATTSEGTLLTAMEQVAHAPAFLWLPAHGCAIAAARQYG
jgi:hypothetical protein